MKIEDILALEPDKMLGKFKEKTVEIKQNYEKCSAEFIVTDHDVFNVAKRPKKEIIKRINGVDTPTTVEVARIGIPGQELIVERGVSFLIGEGIKYKVENQDTDDLKLVAKIHKKILSENKMKYRDRQIARILSSECEVAELWYLVEEPELWGSLGLTDSKLTLKSKILANSLGDKLWPHFDKYGSMDAFCREYSVKEGDVTTEYFDVYTIDQIYKYKKGTDNKYILDPDAEASIGGQLIKKNPVPNAIGKIPIIYYWQPRPDWWKVQSMIKRLEDLLSNHADTNDYFGTPILTVLGTIKGLAEKGENGKVFELSGENARAEYLTWDNAPASIKLEIETLINFIFSMTQTPDISFSQMKNLGNLSGVALKLMFLDPLLKALAKQETFGEMIQRRTNLILNTIGRVISTRLAASCSLIEIEPEFIPYLPSNDGELVQNLYTATGNKAFLSVKKAVELSPFTQDVEKELQALNEDEEKLNEALASFAMDNTTQNQAGPGQGTQTGTQSPVIK
jgi:SPP1 family phage portal protein